MKQKHHRIVLVSVIIVLWQVAFVLVNNPIIWPSLFKVIQHMYEHLFEFTFYQALLYTLGRCVLGLGIAATIALLLSIFTLSNKVAKEYIDPLVKGLKSVPTISFMIVVLIWLGSEGSVSVIIVLVLFPAFYYSIQAGFSSIDAALLDVLHIYPVSWIDAISCVYLPLSLSHIKAALLTNFGLAFKVGVMAEILGQVQYGIGRQMQNAKLNLEMAHVFAWTFWIILLLVLVEKMFEYIVQALRSASVKDESNTPA